ncbi:G8 domain-containing protein [uncultured Roseovarius sp.]|uniref:G8 domain-containing protein n=1 Tax=uncultured Roseovarius sp. TaxID=293344 RepID=UPI0026147787|nr:G8 domain-containing protein [uncultured Roseovarius sp.]
MQTIDSKPLTATGSGPIRTIPRVPNNGNENPSGDPATLSAAAKALAESYDDAAYSDTRLRMDVNSIKSHCNRATANVVAVVNGNWSSDTTWYNTDSGTQVKPVSGDKILIPQGIEVTYDENSDIEYDWLRVDGTLSYDTSGDRKIVVDTIFVDHTGLYKIGTQASPVPADTTINIEFADNGDLDVSNDPFKMQRGFVCFGTSLIYGAPKQAYRRAVGSIPQGATSVTLDGAASGWQVGDEILITGTRMKGYSDANWEPWENETRLITAIDNSSPSAPVISFAALSFPHPACHRRASLTAHVANLTRNIKTYTAGANPLNKHRAHQLFKNKDANAVEYMEARKMGRTDMDARNGQTPVDLMKYIMGGGTVDADTNTTGRYAWHFHRNGPDDPTLNPTIFRGLVGMDNPGWVYVHHDSHGEMHDCIAYDFQSVGFTGEGGGSFGEFNGCFASGSRRPWTSLEGSKLKDGGHDIGDLGHGFWTNSRPLNVKNCIASNCQSGLFWTSRVSFGTNVYPGITEEIRAFYGLSALPGTTIPKAFSAIEGFENNEAYACTFGGVVAKKQPVQHHNLRSFLDGFTAWEVDTGFHWQYTSGYSMRDFDLIGFDSSHRTGSPNNPGIGFDVFRQTADMVLVNPKAENFARGVSFPQSSGENFETNMLHKVIAPTFTDCTNNYYAGSATGKAAYAFTPPWDALGNGNLDVEELAPGSLGPGGVGSITTTYTTDVSYWTGTGNFTIASQHSYTDSVGTQERYSGRSSSANGYGDKIIGQENTRNEGKVQKELGILVLISKTQMEQMIKAEGVFTSAAGDKVLLIPDIIQDRADGTSTYFYTPVALRMPTNQFNNIGPADNGPLDDGPGGAWDSFNPAGTPGLT